MFRPMRRPAKQISQAQINALLHTERRGVFAVNGDGGYPYAIPVNYYYDEPGQKLYFHGSKVGHKIDAVRKDDKVCFLVYGNETVREEAWAPFLESVVIFGRCRLVQDFEESKEKTRILAEKYYPDQALISQEIASAGRAVQIYEITIEHLSGKWVQER